ncbi:hypothetical protein BZA77DRAFT_303557, partial [Pyronema omphalodes]
FFFFFLTCLYGVQLIISIFEVCLPFFSFFECIYLFYKDPQDIKNLRGLALALACFGLICCFFFFVA